MRSDAVEEALSDLLGPLVGSPGLVITLRRHDEYEVLIERIRALELEMQRKDMELLRMSAFPVMYLTAIDDLRIAVQLLDGLGVDTSFASSLRRRHNTRV